MTAEGEIMALDLTSFGSLIASARKEQKLSQKELAEKIIKEDGQAITPQYLNDIEHDRRSPTSDYLVKQFAKVLRHPDVTVELLTALAGVLSEADRKLVQKATPRQVEQAYHAFRRELGKK
jgi:transcriptional regulator with XRE-family HTH domain